MTASLERLARRAALISVLVSSLAGPAAAGRLTVQVSDGAGEPLAEAVVVARPVGGAAVRAAAGGQMMVQQGQSFNPAVLVVATGASVAFPNKDRMRHHIYSFSEAKRFEVRLYSGEDVPTVVFDKPGIITLGCNIHDWMRGYIYVADSPYFALSDASGAAALGTLPDGSYEVVLWHPALGEVPVLRPGVLQLSGDQRLAGSLPVTGTREAQVPADEDPLTAKFRRRPGSQDRRPPPP
jgi:plastocyanin